MQDRPNAGIATDTEPLGRPTGPDDSDFYARLAQRYARIAARSPGPATELARTEGVTPRTVQRWTSRARELGLLAPGRVGNWGANEGRLDAAAQELGVSYADLVIALRRHVGGHFRISATEERHARDLRGTA